MDYFRIKEDQRYLHPPVITNLNDIVLRRGDMTPEHASRIPDVSVGFVRSEHEPDYLDVLDGQLFLVRDGLRHVFSMYEPSILFKTICVLNNLDGSSCSYHAPLLARIPCVPEEYRTIQGGRNRKKLVILEEKVRDFTIFKIDGMETDTVVIRLDVAESILRRGFKRFRLERLELRRGEQ